jgi:hypothetical protein
MAHCKAKCSTLSSISSLSRGTDISIPVLLLHLLYSSYIQHRGRCSRDRMVVGSITSHAISSYHQFRSLQSLLDTTLCDEVCQW